MTINEIIEINGIIEELKSRKDRSAWDKGVTLYAIELVENLEKAPECKEDLLNGARNWYEYSWGGCSLIYDSDIAERLCTPSELRRNKGGELPPNSGEEWLDVQARALHRACYRVLNIIGK